MNTAPNTINPVPVMTIVQRRVVIKGRFFHGTPNDNKFFLITYKLVQENSDFSNDNNDPDYHLNYDHEYLYPYNTLYYYIRCKLLSHSTIEDLLNGENFDINSRNNETSLSPQQRLNLEGSLFLRLYFLLTKETDEILM
ncbi:hypothetical protein RclHR1_00660017 [Rhizophagus clarus]|uniref:Uncharacterized protein n=1 Tax=Rhizophagus clarus TaxID=94130 RepID=A0A2Z6RYN3_9GLOM|nr:hypothetical protein RclHR1_00660017 [Rhizophagus clarus]GES73880.1 hypothetical protein GLOIN_2v1780263 [Rhizophagus clarus]